MRRAFGGEGAQQVVDEGQSEEHRREEADDRDIRGEREQQPEKVERATAPAKEAPHLLRVGVLRERVVAQETLVYPAEDDERDDRPQRRQKPQRDTDDRQPEHAGKRGEPVPAGAGDAAAAPPLE